MMPFAEDSPIWSNQLAQLVKSLTNVRLCRTADSLTPLPDPVTQSGWNVLHIDRPTGTTLQSASQINIQQLSNCPVVRNNQKRLRTTLPSWHGCPSDLFFYLKLWARKWLAPRQPRMGEIRWWQPKIPVDNQGSIYLGCPADNPQKILKFNVDICSFTWYIRRYICSWCSFRFICCFCNAICTWIKQ